MKKWGLAALSFVLIFNLIPAFVHADDKDDKDADYWEEKADQLKERNDSLREQRDAARAQAAAYAKILNKVDPTLRLLAPKANIKLVSSSTLILKWQGINLSGSTIDAELISLVNPYQPITLKAGMVNDGYEEVPIPAAIAGGKYQVRLKATSLPSVVSTSRGYFNITATSSVAQAITILKQPVSTSLGSSTQILWTTVGNVPRVQIYLYDGSTLVRDLSQWQNVGFFEYRVPNTMPVSSNYKFVIRPVNNPAAGATTSAFSVTSGKSFVSNSLSASAVAQGASFKTYWTASLINNVKVELVQNGAVKRVIAPSVPVARGEGGFTIDLTPNDLPGTYAIRLSDVQNGSIATTTSSFTISNPQLILEEPNGGQVYQPGQQIPIRWRTDGIVRSVTVSIVGGGATTTIATQTTNDGRLNWTIPAGFRLGNDYRIIIEQVANSSIKAQSAQPFEIKFIDNRAFTITAQPASSVSLQNLVSLSWTNTGNIPRIKVRIVRDGMSGDIYSTVVQNGVDGKGTTFTYTVPRSFALGANTRFVIEDASAPQISATSSAFIVDTTRSISDVTVTPTVLTRGSTAAAIRWIPTQSTRFYLQLLRDGVPVQQTTANGLASAAGLKGLIKIGTRVIFGSSESGLTYRPDAQLATSTKYSIRVYDVDNISVSNVSPEFEIK